MKSIGLCLLFVAFLAYIDGYSRIYSHAFASNYLDLNNISDSSASPSWTSPYARWKNGPSADSNYFPLAVWLQSPQNIPEYRKIGINMFVGHWGKMDQFSLNLFANSGMPLIVDQSDFAVAAPGSGIIKGWLQPDEPDNAQPLGGGGYGPCIPPAALQRNYEQFKAKDPSRPVLLGFGRGVSDIEWRGRGSCTGDTDYYRQAASAGDILSFDIYPVARGTGDLEKPAEGVRNLIRWSGGRKIIWNDIEASAINGGAVPTSAQVRSEVWMSLIAGSKGINYFVHEFSPTFREDGIFNHPDLVKGVRALNAEIESLAPVLNSPTIENGVSVASSPSTTPIEVMMKKSGGAIYVFAAAMRDAPADGGFDLTGVDRAIVEVIGESRRIPVSGGIFHDRFAGYGVHLYKITATP